MQTYFYELADFLTGKLEGRELLLAGFSGEDSDFVRLNHGKIRQPGRVEQRYLSVDLVDGSRHAAGAVTLSGAREEDERRLTELLADLRGKIPSLPEDPHLLYATEVISSEQSGKGELPPAEEVVADVLAGGEGRDLVGLLSMGGIHAGFANSLGQRNWFTSVSFNLDWSFYLEADKAVKSTYAGVRWDREAFGRKVESAARQLEVLGREPRTIEPGDYRVYLAPAALYDYVGILGWGGYGLKVHRTKQTVLLRMVEEGATLHPSITIAENTRDGVAPNFQSKGFPKPDRVDLIVKGRFESCLVSPRSAKEYGVETNGAGDWEAPESLDVAAGALPRDEVLSRLDTGLWVNNVHYLNYSDRPWCRITGLTRFACFWVEGGEVVAPVSVMRFDETIYRALGENLLGLTEEREVFLDSTTYGGRSTSSGRVPGALVEGFRFNL